jgi:periplasmic protein TonB
MFEDSTFDSTKRIRTRSRAWMIAAFAFNAAILAALILIPLFYPEALTGKSITTLMEAPPVPVEQPRPVVRTAQVQAAPSEMTNRAFQAPRIIPRDPWIPSTPEPPSSFNVANMIVDGPGTGIPGGLTHGTGTSPVVVVAPARPTMIPSVLAVGMLIRKVVPQYPPIARNIRLEGEVVLQATISKTGAIENLRVVNGPPLLQQAALDAVKQWQYRPYLLNGEPVEVETTVNVEFKMN